jgi:hypothetical protein
VNGYHLISEKNYHKTPLKALLGIMKMMGSKIII